MKESLPNAEINIKFQHQELDCFKEKTALIEINTSSVKDALIDEKKIDISKITKLSNENKIQETRIKRLNIKYLNKD